MEKQIWLKYAFVMRAKNRRFVLRTLVAPQTPTSIKEKTKIGLNNIRRTLLELEKEKLVVCKTPKLKTGKVYTTTTLGKRVLKMLG